MNLSLMWHVILEFFKIGLFAVGGGPATIPYLMELTQKYDWFTMEELTNMIAVGESTPGPIGVNMATYVGFTTLGTFGGIVSTLSLAAPSIIVICIIAAYFGKMNENRYVKAAFKSIRPAVTAIIAASVMQICKVSLFDTSAGTYQPVWKTIALSIVIFGALQIKACKKIHPFFWFVAGAAAGIVFTF